MNPASMTVFLPLREFYRTGEIVVNGSGWSILQRPLTFTPRLANVLHDARITVKPYGAGRDGFTLFPGEFEFAYPFADMLKLDNYRLNRFLWWSWPARAVTSMSYDTLTRAFSMETNRYCDDRVFQNFVTTLHSEGFVTVQDYAEQVHGFLAPARASCRVFVNKEALQ